MANSPDFVFAWIGLWAIGAAPALINHNLSKAALLHCLEISEARLVLADGKSELLARIGEVQDELASKHVTVVKMDDVREDIYAREAPRPSDDLRAGVKPDSPFGLFYTSGTTGMPKACVIPTAAGFHHSVSVRRTHPRPSALSPALTTTARFRLCICRQRRGTVLRLHGKDNLAIFLALY
jgi:acyl-coenzyme A synthetase/AMP-(fatty) acid ligase